MSIVVKLQYGLDTYVKIIVKIIQQLLSFVYLTYFKTYVIITTRGGTGVKERGNPFYMRPSHSKILEIPLVNVTQCCVYEFRG